MTQELVLVGLLTGLVGLLWVMRLAAEESRHASRQAHESEPSGNSDDIQHGEGALKQQTIAA
jgi:hypothetical protein